MGDLKISLDGEGLKANEKAPNFRALNLNNEEVDFYNDFAGKIKVLSLIPSIDVDLCEIQTTVLNRKFEDFPKDTVLISMSEDLPFALDKFRKRMETENVTYLSDYKDRVFGQSYQALINEFKLLNRAIFIIDKDNTIRHVEYVLKNTDLPDIKKAIEVLNSLD